jgi:hypothetical protein
MLVLLALILFSALPVSAGTATLSGVLDASDPTMPVVFITPPNCAGQGVTPVHYEATVFSVGTTGVYTLSLTSTGPINEFASFYLYAGSFDPGNGMANCVAADNSTPKQIAYNLVQNSTYYVVVIDDQFSQPGGNYTVQFSGPGNIYIGNAGGPGCDVLMPIPATAVGGTFVADAPLYWAPGELTNPLVTIRAGNSARVLGLDASGQYYKIIWVCNFLWVPRATLGPNYDAVWNGAPLPTAVVE